MKTLIIESKDPQIKTDQSSIIVNDRRIPFRLIDLVVIASHATLNTKDIAKLTHEEINILILSSTYTPNTIITSAQPKNSELKLAQYHSISNRLQHAKYFLTHKVQTHCDQLSYRGVTLDPTSYLSKINQASSLNELLGYEGSFSNLYFSHLFDILPSRFHKHKRTKNPPLDPANALLSYLYSYIHGVLTIRLISAGFETAMGYLHLPFRAHHALSSDFMELYRASINDIAIELFKTNTLSINDFSKTPNGVFIRYEAKHQLWGTITDKLIPHIDRSLPHHIATLKRSYHEA